MNTHQEDGYRYVETYAETPSPAREIKRSQRSPTHMTIDRSKLPAVTEPVEVNSAEAPSTPQEYESDSDAD